MQNSNRNRWSIALCVVVITVTIFRACPIGFAKCDGNNACPHADDPANCRVWHCSDCTWHSTCNGPACYSCTMGNCVMYCFAEMCLSCNGHGGCSNHCDTANCFQCDGYGVCSNTLPPNCTQKWITFWPIDSPPGTVCWSGSIILVMIHIEQITITENTIYHCHADTELTYNETHVIHPWISAIPGPGPWTVYVDLTDSYTSTCGDPSTTTPNTWQWAVSATDCKTPYDQALVVCENELILGLIECNLDPDPVTKAICIALKWAGYEICQTAAEEDFAACMGSCA